MLDHKNIINLKILNSMLMICLMFVGLFYITKVFFFVLSLLVTNLDLITFAINFVYFFY